MATPWNTTSLVRGCKNKRLCFYVFQRRWTCRWTCRCVWERKPISGRAKAKWSFIHKVALARSHQLVFRSTARHSIGSTTNFPPPLAACPHPYTTARRLPHAWIYLPSYNTTSATILLHGFIQPRPCHWILIL